jgi:Tol biopolymer transport system component
MATRLSFLVLFLTTGLAAGAASVDLISKADPVPDSFGSGFSSGMSADGRYVVFQSDAPNLVPGQVDTNLFYDVFLRDRVAGTTTLISHAAGKPATASPADGFWSSLDAGISSDGRYIVFVSLGTVLVAGQTDANQSTDVFLYDRVTGATTLVSHASGDSHATADEGSEEARISADGNYVLFVSTARNLVPGQTASPSPLKLANVFLYHRPSGTLTLVSHRQGAPTTAASGSSAGAALSADGSSVAFTSSATDLLAGANLAGGSSDVYLYQRSSGAVSLVSHASVSPLLPADGFSGDPHLSADGRWLAFASQARNLVPGQATEPASLASNLFLFDPSTGQSRLVTHASASPQIAAGLGDFNDGFAMSADGRYVAFTSSALDLVPGQTTLGGSHPNVFLYDREANASVLASHHRDSRTTAPTGWSRLPSLSADGRYLAFESSALDLVPHQTDTPNAFDVFVYDRTAGTTVLASHAGGSVSTTGNDDSRFARISADGGIVAFESAATNLGGGQVDLNGFQDVFLFARKSAEVTPLTQGDPELPAVTPHGPSSLSGLSSDGRFALFVSKATGLVPGQVDQPYSADPIFGPGGSWDVFLRDRATGRNTLLSRSSAAPPTATGDRDGTSGTTPVLSADGRFAAFAQADSTSGSFQATRLYLYDQAADKLALVNHRAGAPGQQDGQADTPAISADGRYLAYLCGGCHLPSGPAEGVLGLLLFDRVTGTTRLADAASGAPGTSSDGVASQPRISPDGRFLLFLSDASNLVPGQAASGAVPNLFVFDRTTGAVRLVSHTAGSAATPANGSTDSSEISGDGNWIVFTSGATDLVPGQSDGNGRFDVFLYDQSSGAVTLVSHAISSSGMAANAESSGASISGDGRWIVYTSNATDLVAGAAVPDGTFAVYLYDRLSGANSLISHALGSPAAAVEGFEPRISADGSRIAFLTSAANVAPGQNAANLSVDLILYDRSTGTPTRVGRTYGTAPFGHETQISLSPWISPDGRFVAFTSDSSKLVPGDFNANWDAFVYDAAAQSGPVTVPPCALFSGVLRSNVPKPLTAAGACGVPAGAKRVQLKLTVSQGTGKGNVQLFAGTATTPAAGILRFTRGANRSATFTAPLGNGAFTLLPFVAGNGTVRIGVEIDGYTP